MNTPTQIDTTRHDAHHRADHAPDGDREPRSKPLTAVAHLFPELTRADLSAALQDATEQAQRRAARKH